MKARFQSIKRIFPTSSTSIEIREAKTVNMIERASKIATYLEKLSFLHSDSLYETRQRVRNVIANSNPDNMYQDIDTILSQVIQQSKPFIIEVLDNDKPETTATAVTIDTIIPSVTTTSTVSSNVNISTNISTTSILLNDIQIQYIQLYIRSYIFKEYLQQIQQYIAKKTITELPVTNKVLLNLSDSFLLGTSSERVAEHISIFQPTIAQYQLQASFKLLYEPELKAIQSIFALMDIHFHPSPVTAYYEYEFQRKLLKQLELLESSPSLQNTENVENVQNGQNTENMDPILPILPIIPSNLQVIDSEFSISDYMDFYQLYRKNASRNRRDNEVHSIVAAVLITEYPKFSKSYLLKTLETDKKARRVFSYIDNQNQQNAIIYTDDFVYPTNKVLIARQWYFNEGDTVSTQILKDFTGHIHQYYKDQKGTRSMVWYGIAFTIVISVVEAVYYINEET